MIYATITAVIMLLGIHYMIMVLANKEAGNIKLFGQVLSVLVAIIALVVLLYGVTGRGTCGMMGGKGMMGGGGMKCEMMKGMIKSNPSMLQDMCKDKDMRDMMQKALKKYGK